MHEAQLKCVWKLPLLGLVAAFATGTFADSSTVPKIPEPNCIKTVSASVGDRHSDALASDKTTCYQLTLEHSGILLTQVSSRQVAPKLRLRDFGSTGAFVLSGNGSIGQLVVQVREPGSLIFEVASQDPRESHDSYIFSSRFAAEADAIELRGSVATKEGDEIDPVLLTGLPVPTKEGDEIDPVLLTGFPIPTKEGDEIDPVLLTGLPIPTKEGDEIDPVLMTSFPNGDRHLRVLRAGLLRFDSRNATLVQPNDQFMLPASNLAARFYDICRRDDADDHAGDFGCASVLQPSGVLNGELVNGWVDDDDVFTFSLENQQTVSFVSSGEVETIGALYDLQGHRLALFEDGEDFHFRFVRSLGPGRYFVRITGRDGMQGRYSVSLSTLAW